MYFMSKRAKRHFMAIFNEEDIEFNFKKKTEKFYKN